MLSFIAYKVLLGDYDVPHSIPSVIAKKVFFLAKFTLSPQQQLDKVTRRGLIRQQCVGSDQRDSGTKVEPMSRKSPTVQTNLALFKTSCEKKFKNWKILQFNFVFYNIFAPLQFKARLDERANIWILLINLELRLAIGWSCSAKRKAGAKICHSLLDLWKYLALSQP